MALATDTTTTGSAPLVVQPVILDNGTVATYIADNISSKIDKCLTDSVTGNLSNCTLFATLTQHPAHIHKHTIMDNTNTLKSYLYIASNDWSSTDAKISVCQIDDNGDLAGTGCTELSATGTSSDFADPIDLAFVNNYIYVMSWNKLDRCTLDPNNGTIITYSCIDSTINTPGASPYPYSITTAVVNKKRYFYISAMGAAGTSSITGTITKCPITTNGSLGSPCTVVVSYLTNLRATTLVPINNKNMLYYADAIINGGTKNIFAQEILESSGLLGARTTYAALSTGLNDATSELFYLPKSASYLSYQFSEYPIKQGESAAVKINFNGSGAIGDTQVYYPNSVYNANKDSRNLNLPTGISFSMRTVPLSTESSSVTITISVSSTRAPGLYTISGVTSTSIHQI